MNNRFFSNPFHKVKTNMAWLTSQTGHIKDSALKSLNTGKSYFSHLYNSLPDIKLTTLRASIMNTSINFSRLPEKFKFNMIFLIFSNLATIAKASTDYYFFNPEMNETIYQLKTELKCYTNSDALFQLIEASCNATTVNLSGQTQFDMIYDEKVCGSPGGARGYAEFYRAIYSIAQPIYEKCVKNVMHKYTNPDQSEAEVITLEALGCAIALCGLLAVGYCAIRKVNVSRAIATTNTTLFQRLRDYGARNAEDPEAGDLRAEAPAVAPGL